MAETEKPVLIADLVPMVAAGLLPSGQYRTVRRWFRDHAVWDHWALRALLGLGVGHFLAGVVFFFAYNWRHLDSMTKFGITGGAVVIAAGVALWRGPRRMDGQMAILATLMLIGVLLAVFGQIYQTGADAWQFFALWAGLGVPLLLAAPFALLALIWQVIFQTAFWLFVVQHLRLGDREIMILFAGAALYHGLLLGACEAACQRGVGWLTSGWIRIILLLAAFVYAIIPAHAVIWGDEMIRLAAIPGGIMLAGLALGGLIFFGRIRPNLAALTLTGFVTTGFIGVEGGLIIAECLEDVGSTSAGMLLVFALLVIWGLGLLGMFALWLRRNSRVMS